MAPKASAPHGPDARQPCEQTGSPWPRATGRALRRVWTGRDAAPLGAAACIYTMFGLPTAAWERFGIWLAIGIAIYFVQKFSAGRTTA